LATTTLPGDAVMPAYHQREDNAQEWQRWDDDLVEGFGNALSWLAKVFGISLVALFVLALLWW
jgi:hypothetical protein